MVPDNKFATIAIEHTIQMGHRLWSLPGKCIYLHGHTWRIRLKIYGARQENGLLLDYHEVKKEFRAFLDNNFDHRLCLHAQDPLIAKEEFEQEGGVRYLQRVEKLYPGLVIVPFLPSTENLAEHWGQYARRVWGGRYAYEVEVQEGDLNYAVVAVI